MEALLRLFRKVWMFARRKQFSDDLAEEMAFHREQSQKELEAEGLAPTPARDAAVRQFGNAARLQEQSQEIVQFHFETAVQDLRYALRQLRKNPGFTCAAILILALGIGASTAIFSAVNPILFKPLPYPQAGRIVMLWEMRATGAPIYVTFATFHGLSERSRSFDELAVMKPWQPTMTGPSEPERFSGQRVSAAYFRVLGITPALGRDFQSSDDQRHGPNVVILSDRLWQRRFAGDPSIIGRAVTLDDDLYIVIGVMPRSFENVLAPTAELWAPLQYDSSLPPGGREWGHHLRMIGRLQSGVSGNGARSEVTVILHTLAQMYAKGYDSSGGAPNGMIANRLQDDVTRSVRPALLAILGAVALLLLIACVNVTNLLLARGAQRRAEFAMRAALGAGRTRLLRQLLTESLLLAVFGGALGMFVAKLGVQAVMALSPPDLPRLGAIRLDGAVFAFGIGLTTMAGFLAGLIPAFHASRCDPHQGLQENSRTAAGRHQGTRRFLVVAEVSLALMLLVSAGLLLRSLQRLFAIDPGFDSSHVLTMQVEEYGHHYDDDLARARFFEQALEAVRQVPGVSMAAFTSQLPLSGDFESYGMEFESFPNRNEAAFRYAVSPDYFATMHIPLRSGRLLNERDRAAAPVAALISESLAKRRFSGEDPVGKRVRMGPAMGHPDKPWSTIVGVVGDVKQLSLALADPEAFYTTDTQWAWVDTEQSLVVRTRGDTTALVPAIRNAIWSVDKDQPIVRIATMDNLLAASEAQRRFVLILFEAFGILALVLAAVGIYGVLSGNVNERMRELGVRSALGASRGNILTLVLRQGIALTGIGVAIGLIGAGIASRALVTLLFGVSRLDAVTYLGVIALLMGVSVIACWVPAWRAARVDPAITLRAE